MVATAMGCAVISAAVFALIRRARRRETDAILAVEALTLAVAVAVRRNPGVGLVWHELDQLKHQLPEASVAVLDRAALVLTVRTGLRAKRGLRLGRLLRKLGKPRTAKASPSSLTITRVAAGSALDSNRETAGTQSGSSPRRTPAGENHNPQPEVTE